ncbi:MAG: AAA family ATPase [Candidatus Hodarchaeales archaeon]
MKIGICGQMGSGKTTAAKYLVKNYNFKLLRISGKMRDIANELGIEPTRDFLQGIGKFMRDFDDDVWVKYIANLVRQEKGSIVIDDIRRINEVEVLRPLDFYFVRIKSSEQNRKVRLEKRSNEKISDEDWKRWQNHLTEVQVKDIPVDMVISNDGTLKELYDQLDNLMQKLKNNQ